MGKTAREVMSGRVECIGENDSVSDAAKRMADLDEEKVGDLVEAISAAS